MPRPSAVIQAELDANRAERQRLEYAVNDACEALRVAKNARDAFVDREDALRDELSEAMSHEYRESKGGAAAKRRQFSDAVAADLWTRSAVTGVESVAFYNVETPEPRELLVTLADGALVLVEFWLHGPVFGFRNPMAEIPLEEGNDNLRYYFRRTRDLREQHPDAPSVHFVLVTDSRVSALNANIARFNGVLVLDSVPDDPRATGDGIHSLLKTVG